ncbi:MAG: DUF488 family protein [Liquorilactobacillus nagelii]|jgi:uncharacterized protein YeaO (DUF488 family)|uniref:MarR family transcriptional regulator n=1 Tax=Liquorilactobacillus nagelii TaxID=82688 RepID=A0A3Q8CCJ4_9LACO|nr:DUF488 family protein [Liquorilactobacillus nagelii]AUJ32647.1 hypothetical protein BSQ50_08930 [Liquorilactobacillus nagelii]MCC7617209.1 hypothetical protein [Liquorilactobacillus nagelii]MCP9315721.1 DUF488 family protein [Liquorilactobacillus nagelii]
MQIKLVRIYQKTSNFTGYRILVDRLWPRGISKERAHLDQWFKEIGPSKSLRQWFNHDPAKFCEFRDKYLFELKQNPQTTAFIQLVSQQLMQQDVIFLFGAKDLQHNQAVVLKQFVEQRLS